MDSNHRLLVFTYLPCGFFHLLGTVSAVTVGAAIVASVLGWEYYGDIIVMTWMVTIYTCRTMPT